MRHVCGLYLKFKIFFLSLRDKKVDGHAFFFDCVFATICYGCGTLHFRVYFQRQI